MLRRVAREADRKTVLGSVWLREEPSPTKAPLSREDIVLTAIKLLDREGLDAFSMRMMAAELGTAATRCVPRKPADLRIVCRRSVSP